MQDASLDLLVTASRLTQALGQQHVVIIGGLAAFLFGVECYTDDVDLATDLSPEETARRLAAASLRPKMRRGGEGGPVPWLVATKLDDIPVQILSMRVIGADQGLPTRLDEYGVQLVSIKGFIRSSPKFRQKRVTQC